MGYRRTISLHLKLNQKWSRQWGPPQFIHNVKQPEIIVHNELTDDNQDFVTGKFCAPIFICDQNGTLLKRDNELLAKENNYPNIRNGTLTFIKYNDVIYGITCRHVVEALNKYNEINKKHWLDNYHVSGQLPDVAQMHFFIPKNEYQIHINSDFYFIRGDEFTNEYPDIAITVIDRNVLKLSNRVPIDIQDVDNNFIMVLHSFPWVYLYIVVGSVHVVILHWQILWKEEANARYGIL